MAKYLNASGLTYLWQKIKATFKTKQTAVSDPTASSSTSTTFISNISQDANGVITATKKTVASSTDTKVTQEEVTSSNDNKDYRVLLSGTDDDTTRTEGAHKASNIKFNPYRGIFRVPYLWLRDYGIGGRIDFGDMDDETGKSYCYLEEDTDDHMHIHADNGVKFTGGLVTAPAFIKKGGTAAQILKADGSVVSAGTNGQVLKMVSGVPAWSTDNNTDTKVTQTATDSTDADYEVIFSNTADNTTRTEAARKSSWLTFNPSSHLLSINAEDTGVPIIQLARGVIGSGNYTDWRIANESGALKFIFSKTAGGWSVATTLNTNGSFTTSDIRQKNIVGELDLSKAYDLVEKCQTILYTLKDNPEATVQIGMIAQEIREYFPEVIYEDENGILSLDYSRLTVVIFRVLKDLIRRVDRLEAKL